MDEQFLLTIQMEYAEDEDEHKAHEKRTVMTAWAIKLVKLLAHNAPPDNVGRRKRCGSSLLAFWPSDKHYPRPYGGLHCRTHMSQLPPSEGGHCPDLQRWEPLYGLL